MKRNILFGGEFDLEIDFNPDAKLEVNVRDDRWSEVTVDVFRSWSGGRRLDSSPYQGPAYFYLSNQVSREEVPVA